jgi:hypothetical protein
VKYFVDGLVWVTGLGLIPYAIAVLTPSWRWLLGVTLFLGGPLSIVWIQDWLTASHKRGVGYALGFIFAYTVTVAFAAGVAVRAITMVLAWRGLHLRHVFLICTAGFAVVPGILLGPGAWQQWNRRPPSEACSSATFRVKVANVEFAIPASPVFTIYRTNTVGKDGYYFFSNASLRSFCGLTENGKRPVTATNIALRFEGHNVSAPAICAGPIPEVAKRYCAADKSARPANIHGLDLPLQIFVFAPDEVILGEFGGSRSIYDASLNAKPRPNGPVYIMSDISTPDQRPLTFECLENGDGYWCKAAYAWSDGAFLQYDFRSNRNDAAAKGTRVDAEARKFLSGLRTKQQ